MHLADHVAQAALHAGQGCEQRGGLILAFNADRARQIAGCNRLSGGTATLIANDPSLVGRLMASRPGFLGVDMSPAEAVTALRQLTDNGARGSIIAADYRRATLRMEDAFERADLELGERQRREYPDVPFEPTRFVREEALWWTFCRPSEALIALGYVPGALYAAVDKLDGHLWSEDEQASFLSPS